MIAAILDAGGRRVLHNRAGANLVTGITTTALAGSSLAGRQRAEMSLFETDEAALPQALAETRPRLVLLHNLFRDQLDRYGEVDTIARKWRAALEQLPAASVVLLNAGWLAMAALGAGLAAQVRYYGYGRYPPRRRWRDPLRRLAVLPQLRRASTVFSPASTRISATTG